MVSGLLFVDLVILVTWQLSDPLQRRLETFPLEKPLSSVDDIRISPELEHCESENQSIWLGMFTVIKNTLSKVIVVRSNDSLIAESSPFLK